MLERGSLRSVIRRRQGKGIFSVAVKVPVEPSGAVAGGEASPPASTAPRAQEEPTDPPTPPEEEPTIVHRQSQE